MNEIVEQESVTILDQTFASDSTLMREAHPGANESIVLGTET